VILVVLKIVSTWRLYRVAKNRPQALKTALSQYRNVFRSNKNVVYNVEKYLEVLTIIVVIVQIMLYRSLEKMIVLMIISKNSNTMV
jgi:hypothetical protein